MYVRGIGGDWSASATDLLQFQGGTQYSLTLAAPQGAQQFKIADFNWVDATNCGGTAANQTVTLGVPRLLSCGPNTPNLGFNAPAAGSYVFQLDASDTAAPVLTVTAVPPFGATTLFVRGGFNDWGNGPSPTAPMSFDGISKYQAVIASLAAGSYGFKVADANWTGATNCGAGVNGNLTLGTPFALVCNGSSGNINATFTAGTYLFSADFSNVAAPLLTVEPAPFAVTLYVRGSFDDWGNGPSPTMPLSYVGGGQYTAYRRLAPSSAQFKVADAGWTDGTNCGAAGPLVAGTPLTLACAGNTPNIPFTVPSDGYYLFRLDATTPTAPALTVTPP
jgi:pullulanase